MKPQALSTALASNTAYRVVHHPFVYLRDTPSPEGAVLGIAHHGTKLEVDTECGGWLRTSHPISDGKHGWALVDGGKVNIPGALLEPCGFK